jgi:hypothetical protein
VQAPLSGDITRFIEEKVVKLSTMPVLLVK